MREVYGGVRQFTIRSRDLALARAFYVDRLGFGVLDEQPGVYVRVNLGTFRLRIEAPGAEGPSRGRGSAFTFRVPDLRRTGEELTTRAVAFETYSSPATGDVLETCDPDGFRLVFVERL